MFNVYQDWDPNNIVVSTHNNAVAQACARNGIEVHASSLQHKYF